MQNSAWLVFSLSFAALALIFLLVWLIAIFSPKFFRVLKSLVISIGHGLGQNEYVVKIAGKNKGLINFCRQRLRRDSFWGLSATILGAVFLYLLFAFLGIIEDFINSDPIVAADARFNQLMVLFRSEYYIKIFLFITCLGRWQMVVSLAVVVSLIWWIYRKRRYVAALWLSLIGSTAVSAISKLAFHRPRPPFPVYVEPSFSFPSGHATVSIAFYGFIIYFLFRQTKKRGRRILIVLGGLALALAIGFSRLYLSVHYLSDVWAGYLLGALWLTLGIAFVEWRYAQPEKNQPLPERAQPRPGRKILAVSLLVAELIFFIYFAASYNPAAPKMAATAPLVIKQAFDLPAAFRWPRFSETITAAKQEPLSFIIAAPSDASFISDLQNSGWLLADSINDESLVRITTAALFNQAYPAAPMTPSFWNGEVHTFGFEKSTAENSIRQRNHARFWKTNIRTQDGLTIYVGTASLDTGIKWGVTHKIAPAIDVEREQLFSDLEGAGVISTFKKTSFVPPTLGQNFTGDAFFTDGDVYVIILK